MAPHREFDFSQFDFHVLSPERQRAVVRTVIRQAHVDRAEEIAVLARAGVAGDIADRRVRMARRARSSAKPAAPLQWLPGAATRNDGGGVSPPRSSMPWTTVRSRTSAYAVARSNLP